MLNRALPVLTFWLLVSTASVGQSQDSDSQTLRQILVELRAMREDVRVAETTQVLFAELELQQAVVNRATEEVDNTRRKLNEIHESQKHLSSELEAFDDRLEKVASPDERNAIERDVEQRKSNLSELETAERDCNSTLQDMEQRLQSAQDKLDSIDSELNSAIARLSPVPKDAVRR